VGLAALGRTTRHATDAEIVLNANASIRGCNV